MRIIVLIFLSTAILSACGDSVTTNTNGNVEPSPPVTASPTPPSITAPVVYENDLNAAVQTFVHKKYPSWKLEGKASILNDAEDYYNFERGGSLEILLTRGADEKIVSVTAKRFERDNGNLYWVVFETRAIDLLRMKLENLKEREHKRTLENLDAHDCQRCS